VTTTAKSTSAVATLSLVLLRFTFFMIALELFGCVV
jgi:hypothetical protein